MTVKFAAQVLSKTVAANLNLFNKDAPETARFCLYIDKFFDCLNARSLEEGKRRLKPDLNPYESVDDERLHWLEHTFLTYFTQWEDNVKNREGPFTKNEIGMKDHSTRFLSSNMQF